VVCRPGRDANQEVDLQPFAAQAKERAVHERTRACLRSRLRGGTQSTPMPPSLAIPAPMQVLACSSTGSFEHVLDRSGGVGGGKPANGGMLKHAVDSHFNSQLTGS
jgi:hypothetical protein